MLSQYYYLKRLPLAHTRMREGMVCFLNVVITRMRIELLEKRLYFMRFRCKNSLTHAGCILLLFELERREEIRRDDHQP